MKMFIWLRSLPWALAAIAIASALAAAGPDPIKVGVIVPMSGPFASIAEKLESTLSKYGVERYGEPGAAFDPSIHDALMHVEEELAEGTDVPTVVGVLQPGYRIGERIIHPARVSVADPN